MKMKKIAYWFIGCLVGLTACQWNVRQVEGNGTIIQKEIPIADYKYVSATGNNLEIQYTRSDEAPALSVSCDENIWPLVEIRVSNDTLTIEPKPEGTPLYFNTHQGQEFHLVIEGRLLVNINGKELELDPGDTLYFDSGIPHGLKALDGKHVKFLAIVIQ